MKIYYYRAVKKINEDDLIDLFQKVHFYNDGYLVKLLVFKGVLYFWSSTKITMTEVEKKFPDAFQYTESITFDGEELFTNH